MATCDISLEEMELAVATNFGVRKHVIVPNVSRGLKIHECDLLVLRETGYALEVEIKRSVSDMRKDLNKKHAHVDPLNRIKELWFAVPESIAGKIEGMLPEGAGLIVCRRGRGGVRARRVVKAKPIKGAVPFKDHEAEQLKRLGAMRVWGLKRKLINLGKK